MTTAASLSCPSTKMSASTVSTSPTTRLTGKRPPSSSGDTRSTAMRLAASSWSRRSLSSACSAMSEGSATEPRKIRTASGSRVTGRPATKGCGVTPGVASWKPAIRPPVAVSNGPSSIPSGRARSGLITASAALSAASGVPASSLSRPTTRPLGAVTRRNGPVGGEGRRRCLEAVGLGDEPGEVDPALAGLLGPVLGPGLDRVEPAAAAILEAHRHQHAGGGGQGIEVAGAVEPGDLVRLLDVEGGGEAGRVVVFREGHRGRDPAQLLLLVQEPAVVEVPPAAAVQDQVEAAAGEGRAPGRTGSPALPP